MSSAESTHVNTRLNPDNFLTYLSGLNLTASDLNLVLNSSSPESDTPNVAMAFSGGGYRAMLSGGGGLYGTDFRNPVSSFSSSDLDREKTRGGGARHLSPPSFPLLLIELYNPTKRRLTSLSLGLFDLQEAVAAGTAGIGGVASYMAGLSFVAFFFLFTSPFCSSLTLVFV